MCDYATTSGTFMQWICVHAHLHTNTYPHTHFDHFVELVHELLHLQKHNIQKLWPAVTKILCHYLPLLFDGLQPGMKSIYFFVCTLQVNKTTHVVSHHYEGAKVTV